jgi:mannose-6-phosphate isomerase-like protein (cupin superfamily)
MKLFKFSLLRNVFQISLFFIAVGLFAQSNGMNSTEMSIAKTINDTDIVWNPAPDFFPGCSFTILHGDIAKPNLDFFFKVEPNTEVIYHTHSSAERMVLISGEMEVQYEGENPQILKAGTYAYGPANKPHRAKCLDNGECVLFIAMVEPFDAIPID